MPCSKKTGWPKRAASLVCGWTKHFRGSGRYAKWPSELDLGALNLGRRHRDPVSFHQHLISGRRLTIDTDQVVLGFCAFHLQVEEVLNCGAAVDVDVVGETAAVIIDKQDFHIGMLLVCWDCSARVTPPMAVIRRRLQVSRLRLNG